MFPKYSRPLKFQKNFLCSSWVEWRNILDRTPNQGRRKLLYGAGAEQKCRPAWLAHVKNFKKHWLKHSKTVPKKRNLDQNINDSKTSYLEFFSGKYYFGHAKVLYLFRRSIRYHQSFFLFSDFVVGSIKAKKTSKIDHTFYNTVLFKKIHSFYKPQTHLKLKMICCLNTAKNLSDFTNFQQTSFCLVSEKIFVLYHFLTP